MLPISQERIGCLFSQKNLTAITQRNTAAVNFGKSCSDLSRFFTQQKEIFLEQYHISDIFTY